MQKRNRSYSYQYSPSGTASVGESSAATPLNRLAFSKKEEDEMRADLDSKRETSGLNLFEHQAGSG